jgi:hypothetical protein
MQLPEQSKNGSGKMHEASLSVASILKLQALTLVQPGTSNSLHTPSKSISFKQFPSQSRNGSGNVQAPASVAVIS